MSALVIRNVDVAGRTGVDVRIEAGRIAAIGERLPSAPDELDGRGGALIPGLADHHIHLFALAAQGQSVDVAGAATAAAFRDLVDSALARRAPGAWLRVTGYHESVAGELGRAELDAIAPAHPLRVQHQTGALWVLNSPALALVGDDGASVLERDPARAPTGRIWRGDAWLRERLGDDAPPLAPVGAQLAAYGVTAVTDASVTTDQPTADRLAAAHRSGELPQRLTLMSAGALAAPADGAFGVGPVKVLLDDHDLPDIETFAGWIGGAREQGRAVAVHCVTAAELAVTLAAFEAAGARADDRIEHGGVIARGAIAAIKTLGLTVVTQPAFVRERGDRYLADVDPGDIPDLYRCASLVAAGVPVGFSSDAPYASPDPWAAIATAADRCTAGGAAIGEAERMAPAAALDRYLSDPADPGGPPRQVVVGAPADLCLLKAPLSEARAAPDATCVSATLIGGRVAFRTPP